MKLDLAIAGFGAVTPAGVGIDALLTGKATAQKIAPLGEPKTTFPVLRVDLKNPSFGRWQQEPRLRRASPLTFFLIEAAAQPALVSGHPQRRPAHGEPRAFSRNGF
jgi:hypothetical protein